MLAELGQKERRSDAHSVIDVEELACKVAAIWENGSTAAVIVFNHRRQRPIIESGAWASNVRRIETDRQTRTYPSSL